MTAFDCEVVGKIGSMALISKMDNDVDYNIFSRIGNQLKPGMIWVSSGATEIGRLDYMKRNGGKELELPADDAKTDYSAQGQAILMGLYRQFIPPEYSVRQVLVEHQHFNDPPKREHIRQFLIRAAQQNAIPIINYNDPASPEENRRMELRELREHAGESQHIVELVDNDETAAYVAVLMNARKLVIMTSVEGIYRDPNDPSTLIREISGKNVAEVEENIHLCQQNCVGASRQGAGGAWAKLQYIVEPVRRGTRVIIGHARHPLGDLLEEKVPCTVIGVR
ncbi:MAG: uridylate kinase [Christensenellales bacterium]|jgi:glutamate 5-kinase